MSNFIQMCLSGRALLEDIDDYVEEWHEGDSAEKLHQFLGMTKREYALWVADPEILPHIVTAHKQDRSVSDVLDDVMALPIAARSDGPDKALKLMAWMKQEGLWE